MAVRRSRRGARAMAVTVDISAGESPLTKLSNDISSRLAVQSPVAAAPTAGLVSSPLSEATPTAAAVAVRTPVLAADRLMPLSKLPPPLSIPQSTDSSARWLRTSRPDADRGPDQPAVCRAMDADVDEGESRELAALVAGHGATNLLDSEGHPNRSLFPSRDQPSPAASAVASPCEPCLRGGKKRGHSGDSHELDSSGTDVPCFDIACDTSSGTIVPALRIATEGSQLEPPPLHTVQSPVLSCPLRAPTLLCGPDDEVGGGSPGGTLPGGGRVSASLTTSVCRSSTDGCIGRKANLPQQFRPPVRQQASKSDSSMQVLGQQNEHRGDRLAAGSVKRLCTGPLPVPSSPSSAHATAERPRPNPCAERSHSLPDTNQKPTKRLPYTLNGRTQCNTISADTLTGLMRGDFGELAYRIIDCRFPYEYNGGHIVGATNIYTPQELERLFFNARQPIPNDGHRTVVVFHCEYSSRRAPKLYGHLREIDRSINMERYPHLDYPEIYVLEKGYRAFVSTHEDWCEEGMGKTIDDNGRADHSGTKYVGMCDELYGAELKDAEKLYKAVWREDRSRPKGVRRSRSAVGMSADAMAAGNSVPVRAARPALYRCISASLP
eukprot:SAG31_NODE_972_length_10644_cov_3.435372_1_plen_608_part_00